MGTLVDVGRGKISADSVPEIIASLDRTRAGHTAPPQGLYLNEVFYNENLTNIQIIQSQIDDLIEKYYESIM